MIPEKFGRYEVLAEVGDGAMGRVYTAWDPAVGRVVAVKTVKRELLTRDTTAEYLRRFRNEGIAVGALSHPAIVSVYDVGEDFLVMEYVEGRTLQAILRDRGRLPPEEVQRLLAPIADAVDLAHRRSIVHRDIKPANVMVQTEGQPKLMDFGVAKVETSVMTQTGQILGSPTYMSPEQIAGQSVTGRSDVYSLAVVAYEMLTGQPPFGGKTITQVIYHVMHVKAPPPRRLNAALPHRYDDVFAKALQKDPALRYETAGAFVAALDVREMEHALSAPLAAEPETAKIALTTEQSAEIARVTAASRSGIGLAPSDSTPIDAGSSPPPASPAARAGGGRGRWPLAVAGVGVLTAVAAGFVLTRGSRSADVTSLASPPAAAPDPAATSPWPSSPGAEPSAEPAPSDVPSSSSAPAAPAPSATPRPRSARRPPAPTPTPTATPAPAVVVAEPTPAPVAVEGQLVEMGPDVTPPRKVKGPSADYPERARRQKLEGTVAVSLLVDENGLPQDMTVVESAGPVLDAAVLDAVKQWRFEPARKDGVRVKVRWLVRQTYKRAR
jgi:serine/threonine-protein kinase